MAKRTTIFQRLDRAITGNWNPNYIEAPHVNSYDMTSASGNKVLYTTTDKDEYEAKKLELQQNRYLKDRWYKANQSISLTAFNGLNNVKLMYRDADLMDATPEIGAALDTISEEACITHPVTNAVVNVYSKSDRIRSILEDLFVNRLNMQMMAQMIIRCMCKYGNEFMLLDVDSDHGVKGWKELPVFQMERVENGITNPYGTAMTVAVNTNGKGNDEDLSTKFVWTADNESQIPFRNWQVAHFRLLHNSLYAPYGVSWLNPARRHWRELTLMEDMMLVYRLERSAEKRVYKVYVGNIDDADVQAYVEQVATNMKRAPIVDPQTGQLDLRKNIWTVDNDVFIPVRDQSAPNPIETLPAGNNLTAIDDIKYVQNKMLAGLRMPLEFYSFEKATGEGKNLALQDIRFTRSINRIQQAFLLELTKVATIHLHLLGFDDDLTNFTLSMNNPSTQAEQLEVDTIQKKIAAIRDAISDPGNGIQVMSLTKALKEIMHWSEKDIKNNLEEIRLEKGIAAELEKTAQIIKKTGIFNTVDRIYGEPGAEYQDMQQQGQDPNAMGGGGGMGGMGGGGGFGDGLDALGSPGGDETGELGGEEGSMPAGDMGGAPDMGGGGAPDAGGMPPMQEVASIKKPLIVESKASDLFENYISKLNESLSSKKETSLGRADVYDKTVKINEEFNQMMDSIDKFIEE